MYSQVYGQETEEAVVATPEVEEQEQEVPDIEEEQDEQEFEQGDFEADTGSDEDDSDEGDDVEDLAKSKGWRPEGVKGKRPLSAQEFLDRESFFERIHRLEKQNENLRGTVDEMVNQHKKIAKVEREKAIQELKEAKKIALAEEDYDTVIELDDKIAETREIPVQEESDAGQTGPNTANPDFQQWQQRNTWYDQSKDPELYEEATTLGFAYRSRNPNVSPMDVFDYVEKTIKRMHPEKFSGSTKRRNPSVEGGRTATPRKRGAKTYTKKDLNENQRRVMNTYVKRGHMTEEEYITELARIGELD